MSAYKPQASEAPQANRSTEGIRGWSSGTLCCSCSGFLEKGSHVIQANPVLSNVIVDDPEFLSLRPELDVRCLVLADLKY